LGSDVANAVASDAANTDPIKDVAKLGGRKPLLTVAKAGNAQSTINSLKESGRVPGANELSERQAIHADHASKAVAWLMNVVDGIGLSASSVGQESAKAKSRCGVARHSEKCDEEEIESAMLHFHPRWHDRESSGTEPQMSPVKKRRLEQKPMEYRFRR
jgi:hypothetical protein